MWRSRPAGLRTEYFGLPAAARQIVSVTDIVSCVPAVCGSRGPAGMLVLIACMKSPCMFMGLTYSIQPVCTPLIGCCDCRSHARPTCCVESAAASRP